MLITIYIDLKLADILDVYDAYLTNIDRNPWIHHIHMQTGSF